MFISDSRISTTAETGFDRKAISGQIGIDKAEGIVEAFVSGIGNKDSVGDIVVSGAFTSSLKRRKPRVVWGHDWNQPIGKVLEIYEVGPKDARLPEKMRQAGIGGLYAKVQFNLNTERGREAFANVAFYGMDQEWSIGYKTIVANFDPAAQANILKELELYELSPVLHGANSLTATISVKDDDIATTTKGWDMDSIMSPATNKPNMESMVQDALSQALRKPVKIVKMNDSTVVFQTNPEMMWQAPFSYDGEKIVMGKPVRVKPSMSFVPFDEDAPPFMMLKENAVEPEGIRNANDEQGSWATPDIALAWSKTFGCSGYHSHGGGFLPCDSHAEYLEALKQFDDNANINVQNSYLAGVSVESAKSETGCSCSTSKSDDYDDDDGYKNRRPEYLKDPMALLLMAYNSMLPIRGASDLRESTLGLISQVEEFLTSAPMSRAQEQGEKVTSGFVVHVKCSDPEALSVSSVLSDVPVFTFKTNSGVDIHFSKVIEHEALLVKVANALASLDFDPKVSVSPYTA